MSFFLIVISLLVVLFLLSFFTKRRFGVLALALIAGAYLAEAWAGVLTPRVADFGIVLTAPPLEAVVAIAVTLLPALILLVKGATYKGVAARILASFFFVLLALILLLKPLGNALIIDATAKPVYDLLLEYSQVIISVAVGGALLDILLKKTPKIPKKH